MTTVTDLFNQAELALAAYSILPTGITGQSYIDALKDNGRGMADEQATHFASKYRVVDQYDAPGNGLSATVFEEISTGIKYLIIRGTQPEVGDIITGGLLAVGFAAKLNPQFTALKAKLDNDWLADGGPLHNQTFTVTGHSLGGYLAEAVKEQYSTQVTEAYLFNAPGSGGLVGTIAGLVSDLFNQPSPGANGIWNIKASEGASIIAGLGSQSSAGIPIQIEAAPDAGFGNHSIVRLTDALAVQALYSELAPSLTQAQLNALVDAGGNPMNQTLESALDALRVILLGAGVAPTPVDVADRNAFYANFYNLMSDARYTGLAGTAQLTVLDNFSANDNCWRMAA